MSAQTVTVGNYELTNVHPNMVRISHIPTYDAVTVTDDEFMHAMNLLIFQTQAQRKKNANKVQ